MKKSSLVYPEHPMNGLEDQSIVRLIYFVSVGHIRAVKELLDKHYDPNEKDEMGNTAIMIAAERNDFNMVKVLFENGSRLDVKDSGGRTPLGWAEKNKNPKMVSFIQQELNNAKFENDIMPKAHCLL